MKFSETKIPGVFVIEQERQVAVAAAQEARRARVIKAAATKEASITQNPTAAPKVTKPVRIDLDSEASPAAVEEAPPVPTIPPFILGARVKVLTKEKAKELGLRRALGALVIHIRARGAALQMGLRNDDVIIGVNKNPVRKAEDLVKHLKGLTAKDTVTFKIWREGKTLVLKTKN